MAEYNYPTILGTIVTFNCTDPGLVLEGPNLSTCISGGEWEPDPRDVKCIREGNYLLGHIVLSLYYVYE